MYIHQQVSQERFCAACFFVIPLSRSTPICAALMLLATPITRFANPMIASILPILFKWLMRESISENRSNGPSVLLVFCNRPRGSLSLWPEKTSIDVVLQTLVIIASVRSIPGQATSGTPPQTAFLPDLDRSNDRTIRTQSPSPQKRGWAVHFVSS